MMHSFLLIGQSNMAGRGLLSEAVEVDTSHIYTLRMGRWQPMFRPINPDRVHSGANLAESFAEKYAEKYGVDVGLICCADGGTRIDQWKKGEVLFDNAVNCARLAMRSSHLAGILWHQGESDCSPYLYPTYTQKLCTFIEDIRNALGVGDIPFVAGGLGDFLADYKWDENVKNYKHINRAIFLAVKTVRNAGFVSAEELSANDDNLHFSAKALYEFGHRYFDVFGQLEFSLPEDVPESDIKRTVIETL